MDMKITREIAVRRATRQNLVRTADRSEKIRTYNYAQASDTLDTAGRGSTWHPHSFCVGPRHRSSYRTVTDESSVVYGGGRRAGIFGRDATSLGGRDDGRGCQRHGLDAY